MIRRLVVALCVLLPGSAFAWETPFESAVSFELGGEGLTASVNYENLLLAGGRQRVLAHAGVGYVPLYVNGELTAGNFVVPVGGRYLYGFGAHHLELGAAVPIRVMASDLAVRGTEETFSLSFVPSAGYRYEDFDGGRFFFGAAYAPRVARGVLGLAWSHFVRLSAGVRF